MEIQKEPTELLLEPQSAKMDDKAGLCAVEQIAMQICIIPTPCEDGRGQSVRHGICDPKKNHHTSPSYRGLTDRVAGICRPC